MYKEGYLGYGFYLEETELREACELVTAAWKLGVISEKFTPQGGKLGNHPSTHGKVTSVLAPDGSSIELTVGDIMGNVSYGIRYYSKSPHRKHNAFYEGPSWVEPEKMTTMYEEICEIM